MGYVEVGRVLHFFPFYIQPFMNDSNLRNNKLKGFENSQMDMRGGV